MIEAALESAQQRDALAAQVWFEVVLGEIERDRGFGRASVDHFEAATARADAAGQQAALVWAWVGVAQGQLILGNTDAGADALSRADAAGDSPDRDLLVDTGANHAWLLAGRGDLAAARRLLAEVADVLRDDGIWPFEASLRHDLVRFGDPDLAVDRLEELAHDVEGPLIRAFADHARAAVARDRVGYERAIEQFEAMDRVVSAAEASLELADLLRQQGDRAGGGGRGAAQPTPRRRIGRRAHASAVAGRQRRTTHQPGT